MGLVTSLKAKLTIAIILILTAAIGVSAWRTLKMQRDQLITATEEKVAMLTDIIESSVVTAMLAGRIGDVQAIVEGQGKHADISRVRIFDRKGTIKISSEPKEIGKEIAPIRPEHSALRHTSVPFVFQNGRVHGTHSLIKLILNRPQCYGCHDPREQAIGILQIDFSLAKTRAQIASIHTFVLFSAILTIASLILALWILLSRLVTHPVSQLIRTMGNAKGGDLDVRVQVKSKDELGRLGESFNFMISSLQQAKQELEAEHQRQLEQAEKMATLGQLASAVAHEVKNPLGGVSGAMQVLAQDYPLGDPKREVIDEMLCQIRRLDKTVKDLLSYARPTSPEPTPCNASELVERALFLIRQQVKESQISIVTDYAESLPFIHADPQQMQQVILNIALNAVQAMPEGGTLTVQTRALNHHPSGVGESSVTDPSSDYVEVAISDTGNGIPPEVRKKVFQPFFTTKHKGTGLGLPICQRIVEQHGGFLHVESEVSKGTTVSIRLPVQRSAP